MGTPTIYILLLEAEKLERGNEKRIDSENTGRARINRARAGNSSVEKKTKGTHRRGQGASMNGCLDGPRFVLVALFGLLLAGVGSGHTITEFSAGISPGAGPLGITAGPDGNLWFTENYGNRIGRITPLGVVTEFSGGLESFDITAGPDGNLWFTESGGDRIGKITPLGVVTEFGAGITPGAGPYGITAGPDGNLWFTESGGDRIGKIT